MYNDDLFRHACSAPEEDDIDRRENALNARIAAFENQLQPAEEGAAATGIFDFAVFNLNFDA